ncbi:MAG: tetrahydromethanopterin S-methyltransferase subunit A [Deltaproteobacteria bacterium]|nr:tetrahydromethanopterin S-methyltransferase subunit A [Deltaproteobacteria bacterium]
MLKVKPVDGYPPEEGRFTRGNDYAPVAVCTILDTLEYKVPLDLQSLVMAGLDAGAAISGMLQTENVGLEKMICNVVGNPNIRYIVLCGRESEGHFPGATLLCLMKNGVDEGKHIIGATAPTPYLYNIPMHLIDRFRNQIVGVIDLLCKPGETDLKTPGLNPKTIGKAVWSCFQEAPVEFMGYTVYDVGAYPEPPIHHKIVYKVTQPQPGMNPGKSAMDMGFILHKFLPGDNCRECGKRTCLAFAVALAKSRVRIEDCPLLTVPGREMERAALTRLLE